MNDCINYKPSIFDVIILPYHILTKLCISYDKTKLILVSMIRLAVLVYIFNLLKSYKIIEFNSEKIPQTLFYVIVAFYLFLNMVVIIVALFKKPAFDKDEIDRNATEIAQHLKQNQLSKPNIP